MVTSKGGLWAKAVGRTLLVVEECEKSGRGPENWERRRTRSGTIKSTQAAQLPNGLRGRLRKEWGKQTWPEAIARGGGRKRSLLRSKGLRDHPD